MFGTTSTSTTRRTVVSLAVLIVAFGVISPFAATAAVRYSDTGHDPDDVSTSVDIRSTSRSVIQKETGHRVVKIAVRGWGPFPTFPDGSEGYLKLDTRGGPFADARLRIRIGRDELCIVPGQSVSYDAYRTQGPDDWFACRVPFSALRVAGAKPNKPIRWKLDLTHDDGGPTDQAPNRGWYS